MYFYQNSFRDRIADVCIRGQEACLESNARPPKTRYLQPNANVSHALYGGEVFDVVRPDEMILIGPRLR